MVWIFYNIIAPAIALNPRYSKNTFIYTKIFAILLLKYSKIFDNYLYFFILLIISAYGINLFLHLCIYNNHSKFTSFCQNQILYKIYSSSMLYLPQNQKNSLIVFKASLESF